MQCSTIHSVNGNSITRAWPCMLRRCLPKSIKVFKCSMTLAEEEAINLCYRGLKLFIYKHGGVLERLSCLSHLNGLNREEGCSTGRLRLFVIVSLFKKHVVDSLSPHSSHLNMTNKSSQRNLWNDKKREHKGAVTRFVNESKIYKRK